MSLKIVNNSFSDFVVNAFDDMRNKSSNFENRTSQVAGPTVIVSFLNVFNFKLADLLSEIAFQYTLIITIRLLFNISKSLEL